MGDRYRSVKYPLHSVRPFMYSRAALRDVTPSLPDEDPEAVQAYLEGQVREATQGCMPFLAQKFRATATCGAVATFFKAHHGPNHSQ